MTQAAEVSEAAGTDEWVPFTEGSRRFGLEPAEFLRRLRAGELEIRADSSGDACWLIRVPGAAPDLPLEGSSGKSVVDAASQMLPADGVRELRRMVLRLRAELALHTAGHVRAARRAVRRSAGGGAPDGLRPTRTLRRRSGAP